MSKSVDLSKFLKDMSNFEKNIKELNVFENKAGLEEIAKRNAPVKTGALRNSIKASTDKDNLKLEMLEYGEIVSNGSRNISGNNFLEISQQEMLNQVKKDLKNKGFEVRG